jgi:hypothetical protein
MESVQPVFRSTIYVSICFYMNLLPQKVSARTVQRHIYELGFKHYTVRKRWVSEKLTAKNTDV